MFSPTSKAKTKELTYVLTEERGVPSFSPLHSDTLLNVVFLEHIVGTMVKDAFDGKSENCLAAEWSASDGGLRYSFKFRDGISSEDGQPITAARYHKNLLRLFRLYIKANKDIPVFEQLQGFQDFRRGKTPEVAGIKSSDNTLEFKFTANPDGIMEFLSMPYYGLYSDSDFNSDGSWKDEHKITATGPWRLATFQKNSIKLERRKDWFQNSPEAPDFVKVLMLPFVQAKKLPPARTIINKRIEGPADVPGGYRKFLGTPTDLVSVVLSPYREGPFKSAASRRSFSRALRNAAESEVISSEISRNTASFYPGQKLSPVSKSAPVSFKSWEKYNLSAVTSNALTPAQLAYAKTVLKRAAAVNGMGISFTGEDRSKPGWKERLDDLKEMDIRVVRVDVGGSYEPWVVRMMFCSRLGVSFPDPSGGIAGLTKDLSDRTPETAAAFERIVAEDAAVIPLFNSAFSWLVSDDIVMDRFSPTSNLIRFEKVQLK